MRKTLFLAVLVTVIASALSAQVFKPNSLVVSRSVYAGDASTVSVGQTLPPNCVAQTITLSTGTKVKVKCATAVADGTYPTIFNNDVPDGSFGITSPIFLDDISTDGDLLGTVDVPSDRLVTSFSSKSELSLNRSTDAKSITFVGYHGGPGFVTGPNQLDISNSNTPGVVDPTNPVTSQYYRSVAEIDAYGNIQYTDGNAYSGNNGRAAIKAGGTYYLTGNDNNGGIKGSDLTNTTIGQELISSTGAELLVPGQIAPIPPNIDMIGDFEVTQLGYTTPDKPGKDNNFRGLTIFNNTLYVTKGSGGNGINTVYQVGSAGNLPSGSQADLANTPITILTGFPTSLASGVDQNGNPAPVMYPFGIFFANDNTLYVCNEGDGTLVSPAVNGNVADADSQANAGIQKWGLSKGTWHLLYTLNNGLNIGIPYSVAGYPAELNPATDGCRNLTGRVDGKGTVQLFAVTSTVSPSGDQGADPNQLVRVIDSLKATTMPTGDPNLENFVTLRSAQYGEVFRGVAFAPEK